MIFNYTLRNSWPPLAWVAQCPTGADRIDVLHGNRVETREAWFCEATWAGEFFAGDFDRTDIVAGTGGRLRDSEVTFVSPGSTVDRLQYFHDASGLCVSNSLCALLSAIGARVDPTHADYPWDFDSIVRGLDAYKRDIGTDRGPVQLVYFHNVVWEGRKVSLRPKPLANRDFSSFEAYYGFLDSAMRSVAKNAADPQRAHRYELLCTISNGHDSPTVAVLARGAGCSRAFTFNASREGRDDSGEKIGKLLGMETTVINRDAWRAMPLPEVPFIAGSASAGEVLFKGAESLLGGTVLLSGFSGGSVWDKSPGRRNTALVRSDTSGLCLTEYRLHAGFLHCPVPFWGARQAEDICAISRSDELKPWDIGEHGRPICRRIVEEAGVPRDWFGQGKRGVSVHLFRPTHFLEAQTMEDYFKWSGENAREWKKRGRVRPRPALAKAFDRGLVALTYILDLARRNAPSRRLRSSANRWMGRLQRPRYIRRYTFPWAVSRTQDLYPLSAERNLPKSL